jgi:sarcosine oxidase, subunit beta
MRTEADVVVIGAGIVGSATALELTRADYRVVVVDRAEPNRAGSGTTAGNLHIQSMHGGRPGQLVTVDAERLVPVQRAASELWDTYDNSVPGLGLVRCGGYSVAETDEQTALLERKSQWERDAGIPTRVLTGDQARAQLPVFGPVVRAATWCDWDGFAHPDIAGPALLRQAVREGAKLRTPCTVTGLRHDADRWTVRTELGEVLAESVVIASGPWIAPVAALAGVSLRVTPVSLQMHTLDAPRRPLPCLVQHVGEGMSVRPGRDGRLVLGGGWPAGAFSERDGSAPTVEASIDGNRAQIARLMPALADAPLVDVWTGPVVTTPDEMPLIGRIPSAPGLYVAGGTYSFTFAPVWAKTLTALISDKATPVDVAGFAPDRLSTATSPN